MFFLSSILILFLFWMFLIIRKYGVISGFIISLLRFVWILPILSMLFPQKFFEELSQKVSLETIRVFLDDSWSMQDKNVSSENILDVLNQECQFFHCKLDVVKMSSLQTDDTKKYSPIQTSLIQFNELEENPHRIIITDAMDEYPTRTWSQELKNKNTQNNPLIFLAPFNENEKNFWIENIHFTGIGFEGKATPLEIEIRRNDQQNLTDESVQVQFYLADKLLVTSEEIIPKSKNSVLISTLLPPLLRGHPVIRIKLLAQPEESCLWDNESSFQMDILANTIGMLHLLGAPSWDGRFLRRFLKSEPKFDLISFFILRDPWDSQFVDEREMSLIPFPVDRLFTEELPHFKSVILQNFTLLQFLQTEYQNNLVKFVKDGGGLLFMGGPRALDMSDLVGSPLSEILPFKVDQPKNSSQENNMLPPFLSRLQKKVGSKKTGPYYDPDIKFKIVFSEQVKNQSIQVEFHEEWKQLKSYLNEIPWMQGLHHIENVIMSEEGVTPILDAQLENGQRVPLVVASYPDKGRAVWIFSDAFWRMNLNESGKIPREIYSRMMSSLFRWLLRQEYDQPLSVTNLASEKDGLVRGTLEGSALKIKSSEDNITFKLCDEILDNRIIKMSRSGNQELGFNFTYQNLNTKNKTCSLHVTLEHPAMGRVSTIREMEFPQIIEDQKSGASIYKIKTLAKHLNAQLVLLNGDWKHELRNWLTKVTHYEEFQEENKTQREITDFYWFQKTNWIWLCILMFPLEVIARKWRDWLS